MSIYRIKFGSELKKILLREKTFRKKCFVVINIFFSVGQKNFFDYYSLPQQLCRRLKLFCLLIYLLFLFSSHGTTP